jgi:AcrR family transcriptional regulator
VTNDELTEVTRSALLKAGRRLFATSGYQGVSAEQLVRSARLTRGALYHHFDGKEGLFAAVLEAEMAALKRRLRHEAAREADPARALRAGIHAFLEAFADAQVRQIVLIDGPAVLGWHAWRALDLTQGLGLLRASIEAGMQRGVFVKRSPGVVAQLLCGAMIDAAMELANGSGSRRRREVEEVLWSLVEGALLPRR